MKWTGPPKSFLFSRSISKQNRKHTDNIHLGFLNKIISITVGYLNVLIKKFGIVWKLLFLHVLRFKICKEDHFYSTHHKTIQVNHASEFYSFYTITTTVVFNSGIVTTVADSNSTYITKSSDIKHFKHSFS